MKLKSILIISVLCLLCFCGCGDKNTENIGNTENIDINETKSVTNEEVEYIEPVDENQEINEELLKYFNENIEFGEYWFNDQDVAFALQPTIYNNGNEYLNNFFVYYDNYTSNNKLIESNLYEIIYEFPKNSNLKIGLLYPYSQIGIIKITHVSFEIGSEQSGKIALEKPIIYNINELREKYENQQ